MHDHWSFDSTWQFGVTPLQREVYSPSGHPSQKILLQGLSVNFLGWALYKASNRNTPNLYHLAIDPITFANFPLVSKGEEHTLDVLLEWGQNLRAFCVKQSINLRPTQGGTARQFLRDKHFYPKPRRKVPRATNERVRERLPGNHYEVRADPKREYDAIYIDQSKAHHYHALNTEFPDSQHICAHGAFHTNTDNANQDSQPYITSPTRVAAFLNGFRGLVHAEIHAPNRARRWIPPLLAKHRPVGYFFTNELDLLKSLDVTVVSVIAAWGCQETETGLNQYAEWSLDQLGDNPPQWQKTLLLSTYGTLATKSRKHSVGYAKSAGGSEEILSVGRRTLPAKIHTATKENEPSTNNVLHRGLIEAATRSESLMFANYLQEHNQQVLCIYADAVIVTNQPDRPLPLIPQPWRVKTTLHNLRFISQNAFVSDEMTKIPGGQSKHSLTRAPPQHPDQPKRVRWERTYA
jgi:hypothetical protein